MKFKKGLRLIALILMILLACALPVPMTTYKRDNLPKDLVEYVKQKEDDDEEDSETKVLS